MNKTQIKNKSDLWFSSAIFHANADFPLLICHSKKTHIRKSWLFRQELDRCIGMPIYIGRYDDVADVSYRHNSADRYRQYSLVKVLRCCSA